MTPEGGFTAACTPATRTLAAKSVECRFVPPGSVHYKIVTGAHCGARTLDLGVATTGSGAFCVTGTSLLSNIVL